MGAPDTYQLFPALDPAVEAALRSSIKRFGVLVPIVKDQHGNVLDGHHRQTIADELGANYRVDHIVVADAAEARAIVETLNTDRGHRLKSDMRREVVADLREQGHTTPAIAGAVGISETQVRRDIAAEELRRGAKLNIPDRAVGLDGKSRPAKRPAIVASKTKQEAARSEQALSLALPSPGRIVDTKRIERMAREAEADRKRQEPIASVSVIDSIEIRHGSFWEALADVPSASVDAIITDPPYGVSVTQASVLYHHATRLLRPGGQLVALLGQLDIPTYMEALAGEECLLLFRWVCAWMTPGAATRMHTSKVGTNWKPILVLEKAGADAGRWLLGDVFQSPADDKHFHHWGQNLSGFQRLVEAFTLPGELVCDPYLGGGTTAVACRESGRRFIGCDIDAAAVATTRERLA